MAVSLEARVDVRPYSGSDDPALPVASYIAQAGVAGDASGGNVVIDFLFQRSDEPQISELFNLEQLSVDTTSAVNVDFAMQTLAMDSLAPNRPASPQMWRARTLTIAPLGLSVLDLRSTGLPIWLGSPNKTEGNGGLRFLTVNVNLILYAITIQGYMWGPRSVLAPGGPHRPAGGLFIG